MWSVIYLPLLVHVCHAFHASAANTTVTFATTTPATTVTTTASTTTTNKFIPKFPTTPRPEGRSSNFNDDPPSTSELSENRKRQIRRQFYQEQAYKNQLIREEREKQTQETTPDPKWDMAEQIPKPVGFPNTEPIVRPTFPRFNPTSVGDPARMPLQTQSGQMMQGQSFPQQMQQLFTPNTANQMQPNSINQFPSQTPTQQAGGLDNMATSLLTSGVFNSMMQPKIQAPQAATGQLIPPLIGSGVQQRMNQLQASQPNMQSFMQAPNQMTFPMNNMPTATGFNAPFVQQQGQPLLAMQPNGGFAPAGFSAVPVGQNQFTPGTAAALVPAGSGFNPALFGNNLMPLQHGFTGGQPVNSFNRFQG